MPESVDHDISVFAGGIHGLVICIFANCSSFNKEKEIINKNVEK